MTTASSDVRDAWRSLVWTHDSVLDITDKVYLQDVLVESELDFARLCFEGRVNFFTCRVQRRTEPRLGGQTRYTFRVSVDYYLQQTDVPESTYNVVEDRLGVVDGLVISELTTDWNGTVDYYTGATPLEIKPVPIGGRQCWRGGLVYTAFKTA